MSTHTEHAHDPKADARVYLVTLVTLLILTVITVGASYIQFGAGNVVIALAIATIKGSIVALFFMHLRHDRPINAIIGITGFLFLGIFLMFDFIDVGTRTNPQPINLHPPPAAAAPANAPAAPAAPAPDSRKE